jgi:hypothetical protein
MFVRRSSFRVPGSIGVFLLLVSLLAEGEGITACLHGHHPVGPSTGDLAAHLHAGHGAHESPAEHTDPYPHPDASGCDCGTYCVAGGPVPAIARAAVQTMDAAGARSVGRLPDAGSPHRASRLPFFLPYANAPPSRV